MDKEHQDLFEACDIFCTFIAMVEADYECVGLGELKDSDVVTQFMGSGASCMLTVGDFRQLRDAAHMMYRGVTGE
jgi:hypothetical protein